MITGRLHVAGGAVTADNIAERIEAALARIEAVRRVLGTPDSAAAERLRALQSAVQTTVGDLDALIAAGTR
jgi:hypothetical protein